MAWGWETFQQMSIFGWTIPFNDAFAMISFKCNIVFLWRLRNVQGITVQKKKRRALLRGTLLSSSMRKSSFRNTPHRSSKQPGSQRETPSRSWRLPEMASEGSGARVWWTSTKLSSPWRVRCWDAQLCERHHSKHKRAERDAWHSAVQEKTRILLVKLHNI